MSTDAATTDIAMEKRRELAQIAKQVASCRDCPLCQGRTNAVPGEGAADAQIMFIGEGPGFYEDQQGRPFVGASGKFLDELLRGIGLDRKKVFIANVVKCRPPQNRDPQPDEVAACGKHLDAQIETIAPKVIVTLGRHTMQRYFPGESVSRIHGQPRRKGDLIVVPMYHPAAALHQGNLRKVIEADFARLPGFLSRILGGENPAAQPAAPAPSATAGRAASPVPAYLRAPAAPSAPTAPDAKAAAAPTEADSQQMRLL
jgi:DNA polymerase